MNNSLNRNKVILGLSGGVDSTAAALMLKEKGYDVTGLYFNVLGRYSINGRANAQKGREKAESAAEQLGIDFIYRDVSEEFDRLVTDEFCSEYMSGRTPNPCIICNPLIKFRTLLEAADEAGAYYIATGHYAGTSFDEDCGKWFIRKGRNGRKDQSYMLYRLNQNVISRLLMPLGEHEDKEEIRALARSAGISNSDDIDSQEICFIDESDTYIEFMKRRGCRMIPGRFTDSQGNEVGMHKGIANYTIGQRKGLGIALGKPVFVTEIDSENNTVRLGTNDELFKRELKSTRNILCKQIDNLKVYAKIRYASRPAEAVLRKNPDGTVTAYFTEPQRAPTPGQSIVFYENDIVIGGGIIV